MTTGELRAVASMALRDISYETGPFVTLIDGPSFEFTWSERRNLIIAQVTGADLVAVSRADLLDAQLLETAKDCLLPYTSHPIRISAKESRGIETLVSVIQAAERRVEHGFLKREEKK